MRDDQYSSDDEPLVEVIAGEILERQRAGEKPTVDEYCEKYPEHAEDLRAFLPAMLVVEGLKPTSEDGSGTFGSQVEIDGKRAEAIGDYRILKEIGRGGMGVVYEAEQQSLGRRVALKVLPRSAAGDEKSLARFQREARAAAKMHHTNIVPVFEVGQDQEYVFYAMQLIQGQGLDLVIDDLKELRSELRAESQERGNREVGTRKPNSVDNLALSLVSGHFRHEKLLDSDAAAVEQFGSGDGPAFEETVLAATGSTVSAVLPGQSELSSAERDRKAYFHSVAQIGLQTARALSYAHARGIVHRDIKPSNLLLDTTGVVWVTDFGLAKTNDVGLTHTGDILGTIRYMSPERFKGQCDVRADVYALGLTLFELVTLKPAFESQDRLKLIDMVAKTEMASPRTIDARIPLDLETIILKASDKDPKRRYQSADDMAEDLQRFVDDEPIMARRTTTIERLARWSRRNPWLATTMSVAAMALVAVAGVSAFAAQQQGDLNQELVKEKAAQAELLEQKSELNEELELQNLTNQELIEKLQKRELELKKGQSRLAAKQAEFVAEKGDLAESMLWLARAYEMSDKNDESTQQNILNKLGVTAQKMPRLLREIHVPTASQSLYDRLERLFEERQAAQGQRGRREPFPGGVFGRQSTLFASVNSVEPGRTIIPFATRTLVGETASDQAVKLRFWDTAQSDWTGPVISSRVGRTFSTLHSEKKLFAEVFLEPIGNQDDDPQGGFRGRFRADYVEHLTIYDIESGRVVSSSESEVRRGIPLIAVSGPLKFSKNGDKIIKVSRIDQNDPGFRVQSIDVKTAKVETESEITANISSRSPIRAPGISLSEDGRRLLVIESPFGGLLRGQRVSQVSCFDLSSGEQLGQSIPFEQASPLVMSSDASQVAVTRSLAGTTRIQVYDFESGKQVGESIPLNLPVGTVPQLLSTSPDRTQIVVGFTQRSGLRNRGVGFVQPRQAELQQEASQVRSNVQVFDLKTGSPVTPPLPTIGPPITAILTNRNQTLSVADNHGLRVWQLPTSTLEKTIIPHHAMQAGNRLLGDAVGAMASREERMAVFSLLRATNLKTGHLAMSDHRRIHTLGIREAIPYFAEWDGLTGRRLHASHSNAKLKGLIPCLSPGGRFYLTIQIVNEGTSESNPEEESARGSFLPRSFRARIQCWQTNPVRQIDEEINLEENQAPVAFSPDGEWIAVNTTPPIGPTRARNPRRQNSESADSATPTTRSNEAAPSIPVRPRLHLLNRNTETIRQIPLGPLPRIIKEVAFSGDGRRLAVRNEQTLLIYDLTNEQIRPVGVSRRLFPAALPNARVNRGERGGFLNQNSSSAPSVWAINHDGTLIALTEDAKTLRVRDIFSGESIGLPMIHTSEVTDVCFDPEGAVVVTTDALGLVHQWTLPERWTGSAEDIWNRVREHAAVSFADEDAISSQPFADEDVIGAQWQSRAATNSQTMTSLQRSALQLHANADWVAAELALREWINQPSDEWLPKMLLLRPLLAQEKYVEADELWKQLSATLDQDSLAGWLNLEYVASKDPTFFGELRGASEEEKLAAAKRSTWYFERLLDSTPDDRVRAEYLFELAKIRESELRLEEAADLVTQAEQLDPDLSGVHFHRANLMARLQRWDEEIASRAKAKQTKPDARYSHYRHVVALLANGDRDEFWKAWHDSVEHRRPVIENPDSSDVDITVNRDFIAKPRLIASAEPGHLLDLALEYADLNYQHPYSIGKDIEFWFGVCKGIAEYRRGNWEDAIEILDFAFLGFATFKDGSDIRGQALTQFFTAMAYHQLGDHKTARSIYFEALDLHQRDREKLLASSSTTWTDWQLADVARREAQQVLDINQENIGLPVPDTDDWNILIEDDFSNEISDDWEQLTGDWEIVDGAVCGTLSEQLGTDSYARLENETLNLPQTCEIEYDTWWSDPLISACFLRTETEDATQIQGFRFAISHMPEPVLSSQAREAVGYNIASIFYPVGHIYPYHTTDESLEVNHPYHVRIVRTPERMTAYVDGKEVVSGRIRDRETQVLRFFSRGPHQSKVYFDNLKIRVPKSE